MIVDKRIVDVSLKPTIRGIYFYLAKKADFLYSCYFTYKEAQKVFTKDYYKRYIEALEGLSLIKKEYKYFRTSTGQLSKRNKITLIIDDPVEIPEDVIQLVEQKNLTIKEEGLYYTLYLMANNYGEIFSTVKELSAYFDMSYFHFSANLRILENLDLIKRDKGRITVNAIADVFI